MPRGLFELRRDPITGWWVAVVVDRDYNPARFRRMAEFFGQTGEECANCRAAGTNPNVSVRMLKQQAFTLADPDAPGSGPDKGPDKPDEQATLGIIGDRGSWQTIIAPRDHHESLADTSPQIAFEMLAAARDALAAAKERDDTDYLQVVQNWGTQSGARTDHLCLDFYDLPQIPHRIGEELGGAARYVIREGICPFCRLVREEPENRTRLLYQDSASVAFAPYASRSPFEIWVVPRHHNADFAAATDAQLVSAADTLQKVLRLLDVLDAPPYNLLLHTAPLHQRVDDTYHWHWEIHPRLREIAGLELGTGLPVNPVSPEQAVEELLEQAPGQPGMSGDPATSHDPAAAWETAASKEPGAARRPAASHQRAATRHSQ